MLRFNLTAEARQTADAITAFSSLMPHWAFCGSARARAHHAQRPDLSTPPAPARARAVILWCFTDSADGGVAPALFRPVSSRGGGIL